MSTVNYGGNTLTVFNTQPSTAPTRLTGANGVQYRSSKVLNLNQLSLAFTPDLFSLTGTAGLELRSGKVANLRQVVSYVGRPRRGDDGLVWPTGVQRFGNE